MVNRSGLPSAVTSLSISAVRSGSSFRTVGPSSYVASRPGEPSSLTTGRRSRRDVRGLKTSGRVLGDVARSRKPVDVVMVNGSRECGKVEGVSLICGKSFKVEDGDASTSVMLLNNKGASRTDKNQ